jgi:iron-sulfur cluster assembly protein
MGMPRTRLQIMSLTDAAAAKLSEIIGRGPVPKAGVRVGIKNAGCAGMAYTMDLVETPDAGDDLVEDKGVRVYVDPKATMFLIGSTMDHQTGKLSSGFVFQNPNEVSACGCGESVQLKPAAGHG